MEFLNITEGMTSEEMIKVLDQNCKTAADMRAFIAQSSKIVNSTVAPKKSIETVSVSEKKESFEVDPSINMDDVNYYLDIVKNYETDGDMSSDLSLILPDNRALTLRVAAELLKEEKEAYEFVLEYARETGASDEEINDLSSEARVFGEKRQAVLGTLGIKQESKGFSYTKKQGDN